MSAAYMDFARRDALPEWDNDPPPSLIVDTGANASDSIGVCIQRLSPRLMASVSAHLDAGGGMGEVLRVMVVQSGAPFVDGLPSVAGRYQMLESGIRFRPHFPFEPGLTYRAIFDTEPLGRPGLSDRLMLDFSLPRDGRALPIEVKHIFPSGDDLPENLLRFYVCFSNPMQRGRAQDAIVLLGPGGETAADVLYRAPVELWDRAMRVLTILLDPGRLKRGVGPNRALGPPFELGLVYTLVVGAGMTDRFGQRLDKPVYKRFRITEAVRQPIAVEQWAVTPPMPGTRQPLTLGFPASLDWAMVSHGITVMSPAGETVEGRITTDQFETQWRFTPHFSWVPGRYRIRVDPDLEDPCGNDLTAAFDRPLRTGHDGPSDMGDHSIPFHVASLV